MKHFSIVFSRVGQCPHQSLNPAQMWTLCFSKMTPDVVIPFMCGCLLRFSNHIFIFISYFYHVFVLEVKDSKAPYKEVCTDMQKKAKHSHITLLVIRSSLSTMLCALLITMTTSSQEHRCCSTKHKQKYFCIY